jgi:hypothetical protein
MSKGKQISLKLNTTSALEVFQVLDSSTIGYSEEFPPERIVRLREVIKQLNIELKKAAT